MHIILCLLFSYLIGSIPFSLIIGKVFYKTDVREHGSKNLGGTNTGRVLGKFPGLMVMILDQLKAALCILAVKSYMQYFSSDLMLLTIYLSAIFVILGHCYPIFANFKGGKAVACTFGVLFMTNIYIYLLTLLVYVIILKCTKYVSFASMICFFISTALSFINFFKYSPFLNINFDIFYSILLLSLAIFVVIKHKPNIKRLQTGTENKIKWMN